MNILPDLACFASGVFLTNATPHFVSGVRGQRFPTPFAKPPGRGLSSPRINVAWGFANFALAYIILPWSGQLNSHPGQSMIFLGGGVLAMGLACARIFDGVLDQAGPPR